VDDPAGQFDAPRKPPRLAVRLTETDRDVSGPAGECARPWLCRLVTPPGGIVLEPFAGSCSTGKAALREGFRFVDFELGFDYWRIARARVAPTRNKG